MNLPDPLDKNLESPYATRILSDRGIKQAFDLGLIKTTPFFDYKKDRKRIQPATLDMKVRQIDSAFQSKEDLKGQIIFSKNKLSFPARSTASVELNEQVDIGQFDGSLRPRYLNVSIEARSSLRRLGCYMANPAAFFSTPDYTQIDMGNFSQNDILFQEGDRIAQLFILVRPFDDYFFTGMESPDYNARPLESGEQVRSLDMGIEMLEDENLFELQKQGYMYISPQLSVHKARIMVHAGKTAYRMKTFKEGIEFSKRKEMDLFEPIDISKGYEVKPFEHVSIETEESLEVSPHVGIRFWDSPINMKFEEPVPPERYIEERVDLMRNIGLTDLTDGWIDPGYKGGFSRQPKWLTGRKIKPGDCILSYFFREH